MRHPQKKEKNREEKKGIPFGNVYSRICSESMLLRQQSQDDGESNEGNVVIDTSTCEKGHASAKRQPEMQVGKG